jgi:hypothetical protein
VISAPNTVGVCRNPQGCKPAGDVCKLKTTSCNASCDCCPSPGGNCENHDTCHQDNQGVPRCSGAQCLDAGSSCASSADCCNGQPCVPNPSDAGPPYLCYASQCVPKCGLCTTSADCCPGESCNNGICSPCAGGGDGGAGDGGNGDGGGGDGGSGDGGNGDAGNGDAGTCSLYGQLCQTNADCCNGVPCEYSNSPCTGESNCTCHYPVQ